MARKHWAILIFVLVMVYGGGYLAYRTIQSRISDRIITAASESIKRDGGKFSARKVNVYPFGVYSENIVFHPPKSESPYPLEIGRINIGISILAAMRSKVTATLRAEAYGGTLESRLDFTRGARSMTLTAKASGLDFSRHPFSKPHQVEALLINVPAVSMEIPLEGSPTATMDIRVDDFRVKTTQYLAGGITSPPIDRLTASIRLKVAEANVRFENLDIDSDLGTATSSSLAYTKRHSGKGYLISGTITVRLSAMGLKAFSPELQPYFEGMPPPQNFRIEFSGRSTNPEVRMIPEA